MAASSVNVKSFSNLKPKAPVGLIAGWGRFPEIVAESLKRQGRTVVCVGIREHASNDLAYLCDHFAWYGVAKMGGHMRYFRRHGVEAVTMAGKLFKADLMFTGSVWLRHLPDLTTMRTLAPHFMTGRQDTRDDTILTAVTNAYLSRGMSVCPATDFAPELLVKQGTLTKRKLTNPEQQDIEFGWKIAKQMGGLDIGQSVTVKDQTVVAVEAVEGTDLCIERSGQLCPRGGFTLIKVAKPEQDMRFDVPTIGPQTIQRVADAGGRCIAIEADKTIVVDQPEVTRIANAKGIAIVAIDDTQESELRKAG